MHVTPPAAWLLPPPPAFLISLRVRTSHSAPSLSLPSNHHQVRDPSKPEWLLRLPMTKAAVRGMDTMAAFAKTLHPAAQLSRFAVAGASKRGWTTWTTAGVDTRVKAAVPIVLDELNMVKNLHHHFRAYGGWTFALKDYYGTRTSTHHEYSNTLTP